MLWNWIPNRTPPVPPEPEELLKIIEKRVMEFEVQNLKEILFDLYKKHYHTTYIRIGTTKAELTSMKRIIALCRMRSWSLTDFVEHNFLWFVQYSRHRPLPHHLCGAKAEMRYTEFLSQELYNGDAEKRKQELANQEASARRIQELARQHRLPIQLEEQARQYAQRKASMAVVDANKPVAGMPKFVFDSMPKHEREKLIRERIFYEEKSKFLRRRNGHTVHTRHV